MHQEFVDSLIASFLSTEEPEFAPNMLGRSAAFPLPLFELPVFDHPASPRIRARHNRTYHAFVLANMAITALNSMYSGAPLQSPQQATLQSRLQQRLVSNILSASQRYVSRLPPSTDKSVDPLSIYEPDESELLRNLT